MKADVLFDLSGHVVAVTGAASGIGLAMSEVVAMNGAHVVMADIDRRALDVAAEGLRSAGCKVETMLTDVSAPGDVAAAFDDIVDRYGRLDCVFANAGVTGGPGFGNPEGGIEAASLELWEQSLRVNLSGAFLTMRAAAKHMKRRRSGSIVVTSSVAAIKASSLPSYGYHAAKAGIAQAVRVAALELGPYNVRVNAIAPGPFATNIANGRLRTPEGVAMFSSTLPMARVADVKEIKGLALLLASPASSFITGAIIPIDGGTQA
jgi:NAD(P)-dependent dehydrogenase (short-subunit alcohol dehydrogenase family)